jgi:S-methylmethionine-dependent homocysteine/selenocysteine methylase
MSRFRRRAIVATAIATTLFVAAPASASHPPKSLTNQFPLGTRTLCCQSQSATTPGTATQGAQSVLPPAGRPATATVTVTATAPSAHRHSGDSADVLLIVVALALALLLVLVPWPTGILARISKVAGSTRHTAARVYRSTTTRTAKGAGTTSHTAARVRRSTTTRTAKGAGTTRHTAAAVHRSTTTRTAKLGRSTRQAVAKLAGSTRHAAARLHHTTTARAAKLARSTHRAVATLARSTHRAVATLARSTHRAAARVYRSTTARTAKLARSTRRAVAKLAGPTRHAVAKLAGSTHHAVARLHRSTPPVQPQLDDPWRRAANGRVRYENPSEAGRMARRRSLPQSGKRRFFTDSGLETTLILDQGIELPQFAAFTLLDSADGRRRLREYFINHLRAARAAGAGFVAESPTWRASPDWGDRLGYDPDRLAAANRRAVKLLAELRDETGVSAQEFVISGCIGPRENGHPPGVPLSPDAAEGYHEWQIGALADAPIDLVSALRITTVAEAIGITRAALRRRLPVVISFTTETDGRLPTGHTLEHAIRAVDIETGYGPAYYMINCAHPSHFWPALATVGPDAIRRLRGIQASTTRRSHAELNGFDGLDDDREDPEQWADEYRLLTEQLPRLTVLGNCYGTDLQHIEAIAAACNRPVAHRI